MNFAAIIKEVINKRWMLKLLIRKPLPVAGWTGSGTGDATAAANGGEGMLLAGEGAASHLDRLLSAVVIVSVSASLPRFWIIGRVLSELLAVIVELQVVLAVVVLLLEEEDRRGAGADDEDAERDDAKLQVVEDVVVEGEGVVKRPPWCICIPSNPPIRSRNTNTFRRTSLVNGIYCRIRVR